MKSRTKEYALRIIRMYSKLPKHDVVAQVLGKQVLRSGTSVGARRLAHGPKRNSRQRSATH